MPDSPEAFVVGIDGGYVHARNGTRKDGWFEVIVGKSLPTTGKAKCFGFISRLDTKPKRRLHDMLASQRLQMNQRVTFLSDGGDTVRDLQMCMSPNAEHILDWFHVTMRLTLMHNSRWAWSTRRERRRWTLKRSPRQSCATLPV